MYQNLLIMMTFLWFTYVLWQRIGQEKVLEKLLEYKDRIKDLIDNGTVFLLTGNSFEIFTNYIEIQDGIKITGLGILDFYCKRQIPKRINSLFLGTFDDFPIVGYTSRFSNTFGDNSNNYLFKVEKGIGINLNSNFEGIRYNNLFATYLLGPLLVQNPLFTKYLLELLGESSQNLAYEKEVLEAYNIRLEEFKKDIKFMD